MPEQPNAAERRGAFRAQLDVPVLLDSNLSHACVRAHNMSAGGVLIDGTLTPGEVFDIYFELPNRLAVEAQARVIRSDGSQAALEFVDIDPTSQLAIRGFCRLVAIRSRPGAPRPYESTPAVGQRQARH
jgi:hypothetical protein